MKNYFKLHQAHPADPSTEELENFLQILHASKPMSELCKNEYKTITDYNEHHQNDAQTVKRHWKV